MHKIFTAIHAWFARLLETGCAPDALSAMTPCQLADLPPVHPRADDTCPG